MFRQLAEKHVPALAFRGTSVDDFRAWHDITLPQVIATLGAWPEPVPPNPELILEWRSGNVIKQRWILDVQEGLSATMYVQYREEASDNRPRPAILCWHGHGPHGKDAVVGAPGSPEIEEYNQRFNSDYGKVMAEMGYVTFAIDWIGKGERDETVKPHFRSLAEGRDWCNLYYLNATMMGTTVLAMNLLHGKAATDVVANLPFVDSERLGVMGLSGGGTMALWTALCDERIKAVEIICYSDLWAVTGFRDVNYCGMQVAPGLYKLVDIADLQGLLAPMPLLVDIGIFDDCFKVDGAIACYRQVERIYRAAGCPDRLELDLFEGGHAWGANRSSAFFDRHLRGYRASTGSGSPHVERPMTGQPPVLRKEVVNES
jgi:hypothetical protein